MATPPRLGKVLARCAFGPLNYAGSLVMASRVPDALNELTPENLHGGLDRGIAETARLAGVRPADVSSLLPEREITEVSSSLAVSQQAAISAWHRHAGRIGGLLSGVADLTVDGRVPDVPLCLERLAKKVSRDAEFAAPLRALAGDVDRWQELMARCRDVLDEGGALDRAYRLRRLRTVMIGVALGLGIAVVATFGLRIRAAHARVESKLEVAAATPCAVLELADDELAKGTAPQRERAAAMRATCTAQREKVEREKAEREKAESDAKATAERRAAREQACTTLSAHVASGAIEESDRDACESGPAFDLLGRVAKGALSAEDLGPNDPVLPCADASAGPALAQAYATAVLKGPWLAGAALGPTARAALAKHAEDLPLAQRVAYSKNADTLAKLAIVGGKTELLAQAAAQCAVAGDLGFAPRGYCPGAFKLTGAQ